MNINEFLSDEVIKSLEASDIAQAVFEPYKESVELWPNWKEDEDPGRGWDSYREQSITVKPLHGEVYNQYGKKIGGTPSVQFVTRIEHLGEPDLDGIDPDYLSKLKKEGTLIFDMPGDDLHRLSLFVEATIQDEKVVPDFKSATLKKRYTGMGAGKSEEEFSSGNKVHFTRTFMQGPYEEKY